ncbi:hypothetical protein DPSP01_011925 [Paraphaeosphaeria sporulosa]|uniref:NAD(P)-binding protein n=1 Tax=Paraphaeosphaeria sporulosa TaxID=1460663 RepID=A0A177CSZ3_9PLEO|nr:NAD(P)-binding protein [Paraphaeosphaeria sporulosa]OAG10042.1 NAD(P)-binding protein [Paraphaeosphaeria sporulosa]
MSEPQRILIVGGGQGIGWEVTKSILRLSPQARIAVFGIHLEEEVQNLPTTANGRVPVVSEGDITSENDRQLLVKECLEEMGGIDTLVFTAGVITPIERIEKLNMEDVKRTFDVNVFGCMAMCQLCLPYLRQSRIKNPTNVAYGKAIILSSGCDKEISYHGWMPYCTTKAALTRFIEMLAHEEPLLTVQGVYPKLTRTKMPEDIIAGKYKGVMADHEIEKFRVWNEIGDEMVEPPEWCGEAVGKLALGLYPGGKSGESLDYDIHVPVGLRRK